MNNNAGTAWRLKHLALIGALYICPGVVAAFDLTTTYTFEVEDSSEVEHSQDVITTRIENLADSIFFSASSKAEGNTVEVTALGEKLDERFVRVFVPSTGLVEFVSRSGEQILVNSNIKHASPAPHEGSYSVFVKLTAEGDKILSSWVNSNKGRTLIVKLDGKEIFSSTASTHPGKTFFLHGVFTELEAYRISFYMRSDALRSKVLYIKSDL